MPRPEEVKYNQLVAKKGLLQKRVTEWSRYRG